MKLGIVIPTYGKFDYAAQAVHSAFKCTTSESSVILVDDASSEWPPWVDLSSGNKHRPIPDEFIRDALVYGPLSRWSWHRFEKNGGLTRSWNFGLKHFRELGVDYICCANSDVVFTPGWDAELILGIDEYGYSLVGPLTNAPGTEDLQNVSHFYPGYELTDDREYLTRVADSLRNLKLDPRPATINGFCMLASTNTWWDNAFDDEHVFNPRNEFNSKGQVNPTPLMTLNEYELQRRWLAKGLKSAFCPGSFVFHYRSVSRGDHHKKPGWYRKKEA